MISVLRRRNFVEDTGQALLKGKIACCMYVPDDSLFMTEVIISLRGFARMTPAQAFALCSCFVAEGPSEEACNVSDRTVLEAIEKCKVLARELARALHDAHLPCCSRCRNLKGSPGERGSDCDGSVFVAERVNPKMAETVLRWACGEDFTSAVRASGISVGGEGIVVRSLRRLDELMREVTAVLRHQLNLRDNADLIQETRTCIRRGVLIAQSLYLGEAEDVAGEEIELEPPLPGPGIELYARDSLDPLTIGFSHATINEAFQTVPHRAPETFLRLAEALHAGTIHIRKLPELEVYWFRGRFYTLGNRRLAAYRLWRLLETAHHATESSVRIPVRRVDRTKALEMGWLDKFTTGFAGGRYVRVRGTGLLVGGSRETSSYGASLWS